jgi:hypothetical protein
MFTFPGDRGGRQSFADGQGGWQLVGSYPYASAAGGTPFTGFYFSNASNPSLRIVSNSNSWTVPSYAVSAGNTSVLTGTNVIGFSNFAGFNAIVSGVSVFNDNGTSFCFPSAHLLSWAPTTDNTSNAGDTHWSRGGVATMQQGKPDAASPVAQTLQVQSVSTGTSNTQGVDWSIQASRGTGTGAGGKIILKTAPAGSSSTSQNSAVPALTIGTVTIDTAVQQGFPLSTLTDAANIDWNTRTAQKAKVTLAGNRTMNAVTNAAEGTTYTLWVIQDATGSRTLSWTTSGAGSFDFGAAGAPTLTTTANQADILMFEAISIGGTLKLRYCGIMKGYS